MILCATLASAGLWLLLQRTKTDTRWREFQPKVWFGRRSAPTLFNPWETVPICPTGSIQGLQILSTGPTAPFETSTDSTSLNDVDHCDQLILFPGRLHVFTNISKLKTWSKTESEKPVWFRCKLKDWRCFHSKCKNKFSWYCVVILLFELTHTKKLPKYIVKRHFEMGLYIHHFLLYRAFANCIAFAAHPYWWQLQKLNILT